MKPLNLIRQIRLAFNGRSLALAALTLVPPTAQAATQFATGAVTWDNGTTAGWSATTGGPYTSTWTSGNDAVFEGTAGTVTVAVGGATVHNLTLPDLDIEVTGNWRLIPEYDLASFRVSGIGIRPNLLARDSSPPGAMA